MRRVLVEAWRGWKRVVHGLNAVVSTVLMAVAYFLGIGPVALVARVMRRRFTDRTLGDPDAETAALAVRWQREDIRRAQRPW